MSSRPLLGTGKLADDARAALDALSKKLVALAPGDVRGPSLAGGQAGIALAHAYLAPFFPKRAHGAGMQTMIEAAMEAIASAPASPSLLSGFVGLAWLVQHLQGDQPIDDPADDPNGSIDAELLQWLDHSPWTQPYDLIEGLVGVGIYALERLPHPSGKAMLEKIVDRLAEAADAQKKGIAWPTNTDWIPEQFRAGRPPKYFDLGLAHGQAGVIGLLAAIAANGVAVKQAKDLLDKATSWFVTQRLPENPLSRYPTWVYDGSHPEPSRDAWCYGDPGIAVALLSGARALGSKKLETAALDVAQAALARDAKTTKTIDPGLCHGSFGNAQIFLRLARMTEDKAFAERAKLFIKRGLGQRKTRGGFAGFVAYDIGPEQKPAWLADATYLTGGAGIALALGAALSPADEDPGWDRIMMMSVRLP